MSVGVWTWPVISDAGLRRRLEGESLLITVQRLTRIHEHHSPASGQLSSVSLSRSLDYVHPHMVDRKNARSEEKKRIWKTEAVKWRGKIMFSPSEKAIHGIIRHEFHSIFSLWSAAKLILLWLKVLMLKSLAQLFARPPQEWEPAGWDFCMVRQPWQDECH